MDNYSIICKRCGRKLTSEVSRRRGYGPHCYSKIEKEDNRKDDITEKLESSDTQVEQIKGQLDVIGKWGRINVS